MADIFLSWGKPDEAHVEPLMRRLDDLALDYFDYSGDMPAGADIHDEVIDQIQQARLALICFSDATADRKWIDREVHWAYQTWRDEHRPMNAILPVWVGPHPDFRLPELLAERNLATFDLFGGGFAQLEALLERIHHVLCRPLPIVVPSALLAMDKRQAEELIREEKLEGPLRKLRNICLALGMPGDETLSSVLRERYGESRADFAPFASDRPLRRAVGLAVESANRARVAGKRSPLLLRWMEDALVSEPGPEKDEARKVFARGPSLLVVDSFSAFCPEIRDHLQKIPAPDDKASSVVLWIPPYTGHTSCVEELLSLAAKEIDQLGDVFEEWVSNVRPATFESLTPTALRLAMQRLFDALPDQQGAHPDALARGRPRSRKSLSAMQRVGAAGRAAP